MQSGTSLYLAIIIMIILLAVALGLTAILLGQMTMVREMGYSVIAFYAADAGIEKVLVNWRTTSPVDCSGNLGEATYEVSVASGGSGDCTAPNYCIKSVGTYKEVSRAIEITY